MIYALLLLASISQAQEASTGAAAIPLLDRVQISNLGKDTREILSGRYRQTGRPTFAGGLCFADGTCQTTIGAVLTTTQTFTSAVVFQSTVTAGPTVRTADATISNGAYVNGWTRLASTEAFGAAASTFTGLALGTAYKLTWRLNKVTAGISSVRFNGDVSAAYSDSRGSEAGDALGGTNNPSNVTRASVCRPTVGDTFQEIGEAEFSTIPSSSTLVMGMTHCAVRTAVGTVNVSIGAFMWESNPANLMSSVAFLYTAGVYTGIIELWAKVTNP